MVYSVNKVNDELKEMQGGSSEKQNGGPDYVSAAIMAKILEERSKERLLKSGARFQKCSQCRQRCIISPYYDASTQTSNGMVTPDDCLAYPFDSDYGDSLSNGSCYNTGTNLIGNNSSLSGHSESFSSISSSSLQNGSSPISLQEQSNANSNNHYSSSSSAFTFNTSLSNNGNIVSSTKVKSSSKSYLNETMII